MEIHRSEFPFPLSPEKPSTCRLKISPAPGKIFALKPSPLNQKNGGKNLKPFRCISALFLKTSLLLLRQFWQMPIKNLILQSHMYALQLIVQHIVQ